MGAYAYLAGFEPIDRVLSPGAAPELEAKHYVPILWLAMFDEGDLRDEPISGVRFATRPDDLFAVDAPYLVTDAASAQARLKRRTPALAALCTPTHRKLLKDFTTFSRRLKPKLVVRLDGLAEMGDHARFVADVRGALRLVAMLDDEHADPANYLVAPLTGIWADATWASSEHAAALLSGWGWQVTSEERAKRTRERKWQKAVGEHPPTALVPYVATHTFKPDELLQHATLGAGIVLRVVEGSKVEVLFRDGPRTLVHGRAAR